MRLFFWGQFAEKELALAFCSAWKRQMGEAEHFSFRARASVIGPVAAIKEGFSRIRETKPAFVMNWQGHELDAESSGELRKVCDEVGAKYVFISIDDPFYLHHHKLQPYKHAHMIVTCCSEARQIYLERSLCKDIVFAPPPVSLDCHTVNASSPTILGVLYYFLNPYIGPVYREYGAINRLEAIREMLLRGIKVGLASNASIRSNAYLTEREWGAIEWQGFVPYEKFYTLNRWAIFFNSSVVGRNFTYLNQRIFEILGIGGIQCIDASPNLEKLLIRFCENNGVTGESVPFIFYSKSTKLADKTTELLKSASIIADKRKAIRTLREKWTYDMMVRRIALGEETFFDRFEKGV